MSQARGEAESAWKYRTLPYGSTRITAGSKPAFLKFEVSIKSSKRISLLNSPSFLILKVYGVKSRDLPKVVELLPQKTDENLWPGSRFRLRVNNRKHLLQTSCSQILKTTSHHKPSIHRIKERKNPISNFQFPSYISLTFLGNKQRVKRFISRTSCCCRQ